MARLIEPDDIDFGAYERQTEAAAKVRPASLYSEDLDAQFAPRLPGSRRPRMTSTKLGGCLEFRPGEVTVWAGYNGHRKSMALGQAIIDLSTQGERSLVMSFEMLPAVTLARMARQVFGVNVPTKRQRDAFMRWTDDRLWVFDHMGRFSPAKALAVLRYFCEELEGTQVVIDSMMMVCESEESLDEQKQLITDLVRVAQETGLHIHLVAHCKKPLDESKPPSKYDIRGSSAISDQVHNIVMVWANQAKKAALEAGAKLDDKPTPNGRSWGDQPDAMLSVGKQRNGSFEGKLSLWWDESSYRFTNERMTPIEPYLIDDEQEFRYEEVHA
jgi:twinkle protein